LTKFDLDGHNLGTVQSIKIQPITVVILLNFDQKRVAGFQGSGSKRAHLMRFLCSLPCSCPSHFCAHYEGLDDDYGSVKLMGSVKLKNSQSPKREINRRNLHFCGAPPNNSSAVFLTGDPANQGKIMCHTLHKKTGVNCSIYRIAQA
jgi:hypothetical protein